MHLQLNHLIDARRLALHVVAIWKMKENEKLRAANKIFFDFLIP